MSTCHSRITWMAYGLTGFGSVPALKTWICCLAFASQQAFRHLGAGAVVGAEEHDAQRGISQRACGLCGQCRVDGFLGRGEQAADLVEVNAIIGFAPVGDGMVFQHKARFVQLPEVIGYQVLGLVELLGKLLHAQVTLREGTHNLPAQVVCQDFEYGR